MDAYFPLFPKDEVPLCSQLSRGAVKQEGFPCIFGLGRGEMAPSARQMRS